MRIEIGHDQGRWLAAEIEESQEGAVSSLTLKSMELRGDLKFLREINNALTAVKDLRALSLSQLNSPAGFYLRKFKRMAVGEWKPAFTEEELCHCRAIPTRQVELAIINGANSSEKVSRWTSASTSCGTCRPDVEQLLKELSEAV